MYSMAILSLNTTISVNGCSCRVACDGRTKRERKKQIKGSTGMEEGSILTY